MEGRADRTIVVMRAIAKRRLGAASIVIDKAAGGCTVASAPAREFPEVRAEDAGGNWLNEVSILIRL